MEPVEAMEQIKLVRPADIRLFRALFHIRAIPARMRGKPGFSGHGATPLFETMRDSGFTMFIDEPLDVVVGQIGKFWQLTEPEQHGVESVADFRSFQNPGWCKTALDLRCRPERGGTRIMTETRIQATDPATRRRFRVYWTLIMPGSALIRRNWLAAVQPPG